MESVVRSSTTGRRGAAAERSVRDAGEQPVDASKSTSLRLLSILSLVCADGRRPDNKLPRCSLLLRPARLHELPPARDSERINKLDAQVSRQGRASDSLSDCQQQTARRCTVQMQMQSSVFMTSSAVSFARPLLLLRVSLCHVGGNTSPQGPL